MTLLCRNPLQLPELRSRISLFLSLNDAVACSLVCKDWTNDFSHLLWHTVDFRVHKQFVQDSHYGIAKHGHRIRVVKNVENLDQLETLLQHPSVCHLQSLSINVLDCDRYQECCHTVLARNMTSLNFISMITKSNNSNISTFLFSADTLSAVPVVGVGAVTTASGTGATIVNKITSNGTTTDITAVNNGIGIGNYTISRTATFSRLNHLQYQGLAFTRRVFVSLLQMCPLLSTLDIREVPIVCSLLSSSSSTPSSPSSPVPSTGLFSDHDYQQEYFFQHLKLNCLIAPIEQIFLPDAIVFSNHNDNNNGSGSGSGINNNNNYSSYSLPTILSHFPNLVQWRSWIWSEDYTAPLAYIKDQVTRWCPRLNQFCIEATAQVAVEMLDNAFDNLNLVCLEHKRLSTAVILAATRHQKSLEVIMTFDPCNGFYDGEHIPEAVEYVWETDAAVQRLLHTCPCVKEFQLPELEMDLNEVEKAEWACKNLEVFCARIRGLDTKEKITRTLQLWIKGKNKKKKKKRRLTGNEDLWGRDLVDLKDVEMTAVTEVSLPLAQPPALPIPLLAPAVKEVLSIEERVARHLLRFDKLKEVWLGTKVWIA